MWNHIIVSLMTFSHGKMPQKVCHIKETSLKDRLVGKGMTYMQDYMEHFHQCSSRRY